MADRVAEIRARLDAATPGPDGRLRRVQPTPQPWGPPLTYEVDKPNADLIAHAPADIAWLLAENEAFREQIQFLRDDLRRVREYAHHRDGCAAIADADAIHDTPCDCGLEVEDA